MRDTSCWVRLLCSCVYCWLLCSTFVCVLCVLCVLCVFVCVSLCVCVCLCVCCVCVCVVCVCVCVCVCVKLLIRHTHTYLSCVYCCVCVCVCVCMYVCVCVSQDSHKTHVCIPDLRLLLAQVLLLGGYTRSDVSCYVSLVSLVILVSLVQCVQLLCFTWEVRSAVSCCSCWLSLLVSLSSWSLLCHYTHTHTHTHVYTYIHLNDLWTSACVQE